MGSCVVRLLAGKGGPQKILFNVFHSGKFLHYEMFTDYTAIASGQNSVLKIRSGIEVMNCEIPDTIGATLGLVYNMTPKYKHQMAVQIGRSVDF